MARLYQKYQTDVVPKLKGDLGRSNPMSLPRLSKIVISCGLGASIQESGAKARETKRFSEAEAQLTVISGQKPLVTKARKSVSNFKVRAG